MLLFLLGVSVQAFRQLLRYLYLDASPIVTALECVSILALADRLCLPRLVCLAEVAAVEDMTARSDKREAEENDGGGEPVIWKRAEGWSDVDDVAEDALRLLQPCQMYGADLLAGWCLAYLAQNYDRVCRGYARPLRGLHPENQAWLNIHRWPPLWYLKDYDYYQVS